MDSSVSPPSISPLPLESTIIFNECSKDISPPQEEEINELRKESTKQPSLSENENRNNNNEDDDEEESNTLKIEDDEDDESEDENEEGEKSAEKGLKRRSSRRQSPIVRKIGLRSRDIGGANEGGDSDQLAFRKSQQKIVERIEFGKYEINTWYFSPYPEEYACCEKLFICEFCLNYMTQRDTLLRHKTRCELRHPPGNEIYRSGILSVWEVDGRKCPQYCQNLCLIGGFFIKQKTLYFDVEPFFFYVLTEYDIDGCHIVGYFSKMKESPNDYNLACITTLPPYQKRGYGRFLIEFCKHNRLICFHSYFNFFFCLAYELSKIEDKVGSPEKPLSDFGKLSYVAYWTQVLVEFFDAHQRETFNIMEVSKMTYLTPEDIVETLRINNFFKKVGDSQITVTIPREAIEKAKEHSQKKLLKLDPSLIHWAPFRPQTKKN